MLTVTGVKKPFWIWGTGIRGIRFWENNKDKIEIRGFLDSRAQDGDEILSLPVYNFGVLEIEELKASFVVFCGQEQTYNDVIKKLLQEKGLVEFEDFGYNKYFTHGLIFMHGNCHLNSLEEFLLGTEEFYKKYHIIKDRRICEYKENEEVSDSILQNIDWFIHMDIRADNGFGYKLSDEYMLPKLKKDCKQITIPNLFNIGSIYFPWAKKMNENNCYMEMGRDSNGMFPLEDSLIEMQLKLGKNVEEICFCLCNNNSEYDSFIHENFICTMKKLENRERNWDIKVKDFILKEYKKRKLFYDKGHPTEVVIEYIGKELCRLLGIECVEKISISPMSTHELPIYPCVTKVLGLEFSDAYIRKMEQDKRLSEQMDLKEYIKEYVYWKELSIRSKR